MFAKAWLLFGYPWRMSRVLVPELAETTMREFKDDNDLMVEFFQYVNGPHGAGEACALIARRSAWHKTSVKQLLAGAREYGWEAGEDLKEKIRARARVATGSLLAEEGIGDMKNRKIPRQTTLFRKPETCYYLAINNGSLKTRTKFESPPFDLALESKTSKLPAEAFTSRPERRSLPFGEIASTTQKTSWNSPGASNLTVRDADVALLRAVKLRCPEKPPWEDLKQIRLNFLFEPDHLFIWRDAELDGEDSFFSPAAGSTAPR